MVNHVSKDIIKLLMEQEFELLYTFGFLVSSDSDFILQ